MLHVKMMNKWCIKYKWATQLPVQWTVMMNDSYDKEE